MKRLVCTLLAALLPLALAGTLYADGTLPPNPYRYIHPPPALATENKPPATLTKTFSAAYLRTVQQLTLFTSDNQAGIYGGKGAIHLDPGTKTVTFHITPLLPAGGLPKDVVADGNAYRIDAIEHPSGKATHPSKTMGLTMRYPHVPLSIYRRVSGHWKQLCYEDSAVLTTTTFGCKSPVFGTFVLATPPSNSTVSVPPSTPFLHQFDKYIPVLAALILVILAAIAGWYVTRPDSKKSA